MEYLEFKNYLDTNSDSKEIYNNLIQKNNKETIKALYEEYIKDESIEEEEKYEKIEYYLQIQDEIYDFDNMYNKDAFAQYKKYIIGIKNISEEEKEKVFRKYKEISKIIKDKNINEKEIMKRLKLLKFNTTIDRKSNIKNGIEFLKSLSNKNSQIEKDIKNLELLYNQEELIDILMTQNLKLVIYTTKLVFIQKYGSKYRSLEIMDAVQAGNIGLKRAIEKYDIDRGCKFSTFAYIWIRQSIIRSIENEADMVTRPSHICIKYQQLKRVKQQFIQTNYREPT